MVGAIRAVDPADKTASAVAIVFAALEAVEDRRIEDLANLYHPQVQFHWPPGLPYSGDHRGLAAVMAMSAAFQEVWGPLQSDAASRRMTPQLIAAQGDEVVVRYTWRALDAKGNRLAADTLARYRVRDGKLAEASMYYFDLPALLEFVANAK